MSNEALSKYLQTRGERSVISIIVDMEMRMDKLEKDNRAFKEHLHYLTTKGCDE